MFRPSTTRRRRKQSRTLPVIGKGDDAGKYFRCWNCGFVCNVERDELGDRESTDGISYSIYDQKYSTDGSDTFGSSIHGDNDNIALLSMSVLGKGHICLENGADGEPKEIYQNWKPEIDSGCPLCGTKNWRGDY